MQPTWRFQCYCFSLFSPSLINPKKTRNSFEEKQEYRLLIITSSAERFQANKSIITHVTQRCMQYIVWSSTHCIRGSRQVDDGALDLCHHVNAVCYSLGANSAVLDSLQRNNVTDGDDVSIEFQINYASCSWPGRGSDRAHEQERSWFEQFRSPLHHWSRWPCLCPS